MTESQRRTLLVEIGTEELPPRALEALGKAFAEGVSNGLQAAGLGGDFGDTRWFATPRRLAVLVPELEAKQPDTGGTTTGPTVDVAYDEDGKPTRAAEGFAKSVGARVEDLEKVDTNKGPRLAYKFTKRGKSAIELIPGVVDETLKRLPVPKRMRWGVGAHSFVRPVHWVVMMLGDELVESTHFGVRTGRQTHGHRFHHPAPVRLESASDYEQALEDARVIADFARRRERVSEQVASLAGDGSGVILDDALLDEVTALTEWPVALAGEFDEAFLSLPPEVIATTLVHHQKFVPVTDGDGRPTTRFIGVANVGSRHPDVVRQGYERVIRPRLADAAFFYDQDRQTPLADRQGALDGMLFHRKLGSIRDKAARIAALAVVIAGQLGADVADARRAAALCKCDLTTLMVGEFPELQGVMGGYYAAHDGESEAVSRAIAEHYRPRFAGDEPPSEVISRVVAVADKLDTVCGIILAGDRPTGNKDPFALRRAALGVLRILVECGLDLDLKALIGSACDTIAESASLEAGDDDRDAILAFFLDRLRAWYRDRDVRPDVLEAVIASGSTRPLDMHHRISAVGEFLELPQAAALAAANKRIRNILKQAGMKARPDGPWDAQGWDDAALREKEERDLASAVADKRRALKPLLDRADYTGALRELAGLKDTVDSFFDHVMVMTDDEELKRHRLSLLSGTNRMFSEIADISRLDVAAD